MEPLLLTPSEVGQMLGLSRSAVYDHDARGLLPAAVRIGQRPKWRVAELRAWVAAGCPCREVWARMKQTDELTEARGGKGDA